VTAVTSRATLAGTLMAPAASLRRRPVVAGASGKGAGGRCLPAARVDRMAGRRLLA